MQEVRHEHLAIWRATCQGGAPSLAADICGNETLGAVRGGEGGGLTVSAQSRSKTKGEKNPSTTQ